jgi:hypothetical protein
MHICPDETADRIEKKTKVGNIMNIQEEQVKPQPIRKAGAKQPSNYSILQRIQQKIVLCWHRVQLEHWLTLTSKILKDENQFETVLQKFDHEKGMTGNPQDAGEKLVVHIQESAVHPTIKAVANMELALMKLKDPMHQFRYKIKFNQHPFVLLDALHYQKPYTLETDGEQYELVVCNSVPGKMMVYPLT